MSVIDQAKSHFRSLPRQRLEVPEWAGSDGKPLVITWTPITAHQHDKIYPPNKVSGADTAARVLILKAENENGERLFRDIDFEDLMTAVHRTVLIDVASKILGTRTSELVEAAEKN